MALTEAEYREDLVVWETGVDVGYCVEEWIVTNTKVVVLGDILKGTSAGCERATDPAVITAVALDSVTGDGAKKIVVMTRGPAILDNEYVNYQSLNETTAKATLLALGIRVRTQLTSTSLD